MAKSLEERLAHVAAGRMDQEEADEIVREWNAERDDPPDDKLALATLVRVALPWNELTTSIADVDEFEGKLAYAAAKVIDKRLVEALVRERFRRFVPKAVAAARKEWIEGGWEPGGRGGAS